jgi:hypothetical protein
MTYEEFKSAVAVELDRLISLPGTISYDADPADTPTGADLVRRYDSPMRDYHAAGMTVEEVAAAIVEVEAEWG